MVRWGLVLALVLTLPGCSILKRDNPGGRFERLLAPGSFHEECLDLAPGHRLEYRFRASRPLTFDIHYHEGREVSTPVARPSVRETSGTFRPVGLRHYCMMWSNGQDGPVRLRYEFQVEIDRSD